MDMILLRCSTSTDSEVEDEPGGPQSVVIITPTLEEYLTVICDFLACAHSWKAIRFCEPLAPNVMMTVPIIPGYSPQLTSVYDKTLGAANSKITLEIG